MEASEFWTTTRWSLGVATAVAGRNQHQRCGHSCVAYRVPNSDVPDWELPSNLCAKPTYIKPQSCDVLTVEHFGHRMGSNKV
jgi:hypothetical protein